MRQTVKKLVPLTALLACMAVQANHVSPTLSYRSQGFHADRQRNVGEVGKLYLMDGPEWYRTMDVAVGYMRAFDRDEIAHCLFGSDLICDSSCSNTIKVQGSGVADRDAKAWLADYFYLNCEYDGSFRVDPLIQNVVIDLDCYLDLGQWVEGSYMRLYGPVTWTKWETKFCVSDPATVLTTSCSTGYFTPSGSEVLLDSLADYFKGEAPASVDRVVFQPLKYAKMPICDETKWGFAELRAELGWNFWQDEDYHLGVGAHVAAPTGNKRKAEYVMQPVIGNGNHWEVGGTVHGHYIFWRSDDEEKQFGFYFDAVATHLFRTNEQRTFDLCCKDNSRYMLAARFRHPISGGTNGLKVQPNAGNTGSPIAPNSSEFDNVYAPVANLTTTDVKVSVAVQADIVAMFNFQRRGFSWDLGYNFWTRSCESIECPRECNPCNPDSIFNRTNQRRWTLKGDTRMFGFAAAQPGIGTIQQNDTIPLSATQSNATIHKGTNADFVDATLTSVTLQNGGVDSAEFALVGSGAFLARVIHTPTTQGGFNANSDQIKSSRESIYLSTRDVALQETKGLSHKVFTTLSYNWDRDWNPYLGIGGSGEWGKTDCDNCTSCCSSTCVDNCVKCSLSQWSIWLKGGFSFD